jgi:hypothetical protein
MARRTETSGMVKARSRSDRGIQTLANHPSAYVTPAELAKYWQLAPAELLEHIQDGTLKAIRFGVRLFRIRTKDAIEFERRIRMWPRRQERAFGPPKQDDLN